MLALLTVSMLDADARHDAAKPQLPLAAYYDCVMAAAKRLSPSVKTSGPKSGEEGSRVAEQAVAACKMQRGALKQALVDTLLATPEYRGRPDLDAQAEAALRPFEASFKEDAKYTALIAVGNRK